ncbi:MAG: leucine-rich repeat domain-containing protein [Kiritimatiellae bacterium]|nr:leucine-rich repeat domain-containing protein [Kiritimatiellia bacterium]
MKKLIMSVLAITFSFRGACEDVGDFSFNINYTQKTGALNAYRGNSSHVVIPSEFLLPEKYKDEEGEEHTRYNTITVTGIEGHVFTHNTTVTHITIPDSISWMDSWRPDVYGGIFEGCTELQSVSMSKNLLDVEDYAFRGCDKLESINLSYVTNFNNEAFAGCSSLNAIGCSLENAARIWGGAFKECSSLSVELNLTAIEILDSSAFAGAAITKVRTGSKLRTLNQAVFKNCFNLEAAIIDGTITSRGKPSVQPNFFQGCGNLHRVELIANNLGFRDYSYDAKIFEGCSNLEEVVLGHGFTYVMRKAFQGLTNLKKVSLTSSTKEIGSWAFSECASLNEISLNNIATISEGAFQNCISLTNLSMPKIVTLNNSAFKGCTSLQSVAIGSSLLLNNGDQRIFENCTSLKSVSMIGNGGSTLPNYTFSGCTKLETCIVGDGFSSIYPLDYHYSSPFEYCNNLRTVSLGRRITKLPNALFEALPSLETCRMTAVTNIGNKVFAGCGNLKEVTSLDKVNEIGNQAFSDCYGLTGVVELASIVTMGERVFQNCRGIRAVEFGEGLSRLDGYAFAGSTNLVAFSFEGEQPPNNVNNYAFGGVAKGAFGVYPASRLDYEVSGVKSARTLLKASDQTCPTWEDQIDANGMWKGLIMGANKPILTNDSYNVSAGSLHLNWENDKAPMPPTSCGVTYEVRRGFTDSYESAEVLTNGYDQLAYEDKQFDFTGGVSRIWYWVKPEHNYVKFEHSDSCRTKNRYFLSLGFSSYGPGMADKGITKDDADTAAGVAADRGEFLSVRGNAAGMCITDSQGRLSNLDAAIRVCADTVKPGDIFLCYLATHGSTGTENKEPWLLLYGGSHLEYSKLSAWCSDITKSQVRFIGIIMACHSQAMVNGGKIPADKDVLINLETCGLRKCDAISEYSAWVTSSRAWELSYRSFTKGLGLSPFTFAFCGNGWERGYADANLYLEGGLESIESHGDGRLSLLEIAEYAQKMYKSLGCATNEYSVMIYNTNLLSRIDVGEVEHSYLSYALETPKVKVKLNGFVAGYQSVSWDAVPGAQEYRLYRQFANAKPLLAMVVPWNVTSFDDNVWWSWLSNNYTYFVQAVNATGTSRIGQRSDTRSLLVAKRATSKLTEMDVRDWFRENGLILAEDLSEEDWMKLHDADLDGDGVRTGDESISGVSPFDSSSQFTANITIENGEPQITWSPDLGSMRTYTTYGRKTLDGSAESWVDMSTVPDAEKSEYHFFKVAVGLP